MTTTTSSTHSAALLTIDVASPVGNFAHNWNYIGFDEINYTYVPEGLELLAKFGALDDKPYYVRAHHLFCTGNGLASFKWGSTNAYIEDAEGKPTYNWHFVDLTFDALLKNGCKPFVELGFMPQDLADPVFYDVTSETFRMQHYQSHGWNAPPKDYQKWHDLVHAFIVYCIDRYGLTEVKTWYFELWNEPDLDYYWRGSMEEFNKLYDYTVAAVKAACPEARVGGPGTTNPRRHAKSGEYLAGFLEHCATGINAVTGHRGTAVDFVTFHVKGGGYRADPHHRPQNPPSVKQILQDVQTGYEIIAQYPQFVSLECVLTEIDPDGWAGGGAWDNANLNFRNTEFYPSFVAAAFDKVSNFARTKHWELRLLSWAFLFVGERCFEGTRTFSTQGIDKAILNLFRMYARLGTQQLALSSTSAADPISYRDLWGRDADSDVAGVATIHPDGSLAILIYHHRDAWEAGGVRQVRVEISNLPSEHESLKLQHYRVDDSHSNAYGVWVQRGRPMYPSDSQRTAIKAREGLELLTPPAFLTVVDGTVGFEFAMPVHAISLLLLGPG